MKRDVIAPHDPTVDGRRLLNLEQAARYLGMSRDSFERRRAEMPRAVRPFGRESDCRWDVHDLDAWIEKLKADDARGTSRQWSRATRVLPVIRGSS